MKYNYSKLLWTLKEQNITQVQLAEIVGINEVTLNRKLKNEREFKQSEMIKILSALNIPMCNIADYFFTH